MIDKGSYKYISHSDLPSELQPLSWWRANRHFSRHFPPTTQAWSTDPISGARPLPPSHPAPQIKPGSPIWLFIFPFFPSPLPTIRWNRLVSFSLQCFCLCFDFLVFVTLTSLVYFLLLVYTFKIHSPCFGMCFDYKSPTYLLNVKTTQEHKDKNENGPFYICAYMLHTLK